MLELYLLANSFTDFLALVDIRAFSHCIFLSSHFTLQVLCVSFCNERYYEELHRTAVEVSNFVDKRLIIFTYIIEFESYCLSHFIIYFSQICISALLLVMGSSYFQLNVSI